MTAAQLPETAVVRVGDQAAPRPERAGVTFPTPIVNYPIDWAI
jgi:hypothetical protein